MANTEKGKEAQQAPAPSAFQKVKTILTPKKLGAGVLLLLCALAIMFAMGILSAAYVGSDDHTGDKATVVKYTDRHSSSALVRRNDDHGQDGVLVPISTQTAVTTIYSISHNTLVATKTETVTGTTFITVQPELDASILTSLITSQNSAEICTLEVVTMTHSVTVTISSSPSPLEDATVAGNPSTVTDFHTDVSFSDGLPDATISGSPSTVTDIQTSWSVSSDLPDATISGNPSIVTDFQTDFSISGGLPDATISGSPSTVTDFQTSYSVSGSIWTVITITDLFPPSQTLSTVTRYATVQTTITTVVPSLVVVTISEILSDPSSAYSNSDGASSEAAGEAITGVSPTSIFTQVVTETQGAPLTLTTTVRVIRPPPYPNPNNTMVDGASGTVTIAPNPSTSAVIISGGPKKPEPRSWTGTNGSPSFGCAIMFIAVMMLMM